MARVWMLMALGGLLVPQEETKPGLVAEFFRLETAVEEMPTIASDRKPDVRRVDGVVDYSSSTDPFPGMPAADHFYVRWTGVLRVPKDGKYTLFSESDDGSRLSIDGKVVVDNGGLHPMEEKSGEIELKAGDHALRVELFENDGEAGCRISWESEGRKEIIPASVLFHLKDKDIDK